MHRYGHPPIKCPELILAEPAEVFANAWRLIELRGEAVEVSLPHSAHVGHEPQVPGEVILSVKPVAVF